ncbi:hypothetical protein MIR68_001516 [Amoeboaphelidium protococcarum]|nr:hypothetical protein MIR68_001516 [Amoeboaphelidium protococcarum]
MDSSSNYDPQPAQSKLNTDRRDVNQEFKSRFQGLSVSPRLQTLNQNNQSLSAINKQLWSPSAGVLIAHGPASLAFMIDYMPPPSPVRRRRLRRLDSMHSFAPSKISLQTVIAKIDAAYQRKQKQLLRTQYRLRQKAAQVQLRQSQQYLTKSQFSVQLSAKIQLDHELANLRRKIIIEGIVSRSSYQVQRAQKLATIQRLRKQLQLKKSLSANDLAKFAAGSSHGSASALKRSISTNQILDIQQQDQSKIKDYLFNLAAVFGSNLPPITKNSMRELNLESISSNLQLRHDMLFDENLEFRPNYNGDRATRLKQQSLAFWSQLKLEIDQDSSRKTFKKIPVLLHEIKAILLDIVANDDYKRSLEQNIDVSLIDQQLQRGVFDAAKFIAYIADLLKSHCAPIRDILVENMVQTFECGDLIGALRQAFEILEKMKIDLANDQLRRLRPYVVQEAVNYERLCFKMSLKNRSGSVKNTVVWLRPYAAAMQKDGADASTVYYNALIDLIKDFSDTQQADQSSLPETFKLDVGRLKKYHDDWQDLVVVSTILLIVKQYAGSRCNNFHIKEIKQHLKLLLNEQDTKMAQLTDFCVHEASKICGRQFSDVESTQMSNLIDKSLYPDSHLYVALFARVQNIILEYLKSGGVLPSDDVSVRQGVADVKDDLLDLLKRIKFFADHNRAVYVDVYDEILLQIKQKQNS